MKILDNNVVRDMTEEEVAMFHHDEKDREATEEDYQAALREMGVKV